MPTFPTRAQQLADKCIPIMAVLAALDIVPLYQAAGGNHYCISPFRPTEASPSFVACEPKNNWIDFGEIGANGKPVGGDALALVARYYGLELLQARVVLRELARCTLTPAQLADVTPQVKPAATSAKMTFCDVVFGRLSHPVLVQYLISRGINWDLVRGNEQTMAHLQQVTYQVTGKRKPKPYFALAWKSARGHEIRNQGFQNCMGGKGLTYLKGREPGCMIFEGFMDYLSALTYYKRSSFRCSVLVLNQADQIVHAVSYVENEPVVHWFGDNDYPGEKSLAYLREALPPGRIKTYNEIYREYKDFNDFLTGTPPTKPLPRHRAAPSDFSKKAKWWLWVVFDEVDKEKSKRTGRTEYKSCTFYCYTNDAAGYDSLLVLRHRLQHQWRYYRFCQRTTGTDYTVLHYERVGYTPVPQASTLTLAAAGD